MLEPQFTIPLTLRASTDGSVWFLEVSLPDGRTISVGEFGSESTAYDWVMHEFSTFFRQKLMH